MDFFNSYFRFPRELTPIGAETVFQVGSFPVTNTLLLEFLIILILALFGGLVVSRFNVDNPSSFQNVVEWIYEAIVSFVDSVTGSAVVAKSVFPLVGSILVYLAIANLIGIIPGLTSVSYGQVALFRTPTTDFNTTLGLAIAVVLIAQIASIQSYGIFGYLGRFFKFKGVYQGFKKSPMDGFIAIIEFLIGLLDIFAELAKVISLSFRLFGNMFAGEVLAVLILGSLAYFLPAVWLSMSILFAAVQAIVFGALAAVYYTLSLKPEEENIEVATT